MKKEFVMRGKTASGETEVLNFSGHKNGYAYRLIKFEIYGSSSIGGSDFEIMGSVTAGKVAVAPPDPDFNDPGLIATTFSKIPSAANYPAFSNYTIVNDTFLITQDLILMVQDSNGNPVNWQCKFIAHKMSSGEEAVTNLNQFTIFDD